MKRIIVLALVATACASSKEVVKPAAVAPVAAKPVEMAPADNYQAAKQSMSAGQWETAQQKLDAYLAKEPKSAAGWFDAGWVSERRNDSKTAVADYRKALEIEPAHLGAALNLARILQDTPEEAEKVLRASKSDDPQVQDALASVLRSEKKLDAAEEQVRTVLQRHPHDADAYRVLAAIEADRGHIRLAESALNNARKLDAKDAGILNSLGLLAMKRDDAVAARGYFEQAVKLDDGFAAAWANLGAIALSYRDYPAAETAYAKAIAGDSTRWETHLAHGWALEGLKKAKDARAEYEAVLAMKPAQEDAMYGRAVALKAEGDLPGAMQAFKEYSANSKATHVKEAQSQIASIDLRLKNPPPVPKQVAKTAAPAGETDLSKLPQGTDQGPSDASKLPTEETPAPAPEKPAAGKDGGVQNSTPTAAFQSATR